MELDGALLMLLLASVWLATGAAQRPGEIIIISTFNYEQKNIL